MSNGHSCHYWDNLFAVDLTYRDTVAGVLDDLDFQDVNPIEFEDLAAETGISQQGCRQILAEVVKVFTVPDGTDPKDVTDALGGRDIVASPIYAVGPLGHSGFMPGTLPEDLLVSTQGTPLTDFNSNEERVIAMVDSGIAAGGEESSPSWVSTDAVMFDDPEDVDTNPEYGHSHGTFVASIIRRIAPDHQLFVARAAEVDLSRFRTPEDHEDQHPQPAKLTSELHIADALSRLRKRTETKRVASLNLSLGAYVCDANDDLLVTMRSALSLWKNTHPPAHCDADGNLVGNTIFAAGGNRDLKDPVYPAAFLYVRGVAAARCGTAEDVVWKAVTDPPTRADPRWWITDVAPGVDLIGNTDASSQLMKWSGSSFATAVASALNANNETPAEQADGKKWWLNKPLECDQIGELLIE